MWKDPIVEEIRRIREEYAAEFNYDLAAICRDLRKRQAEGGRVVVSRLPRRGEGEDEVGEVMEAPLEEM